MPTKNANLYLGDTQYLLSSWPVGAMMQYIGDTAPDGWALCHGQELSQATYPALYALIGTKFGSASGGMFKLPDLRGAYVRGAGTNAANPSWAAGVVGGTGGVVSVALSSSHLPVHAHSFSGTSSTHSGHQHAQSGTFSLSSGSASSSGSGHSHSANIYRYTAGRNYNTSGGGSLERVSTLSESTTGIGMSGGTHSHSVSGSTTISGSTGLAGAHNHTYSGTTSNAGSGSAFSTLPPFVAVNHIIRITV